MCMQKAQNQNIFLKTCAFYSNLENNVNALAFFAYDAMPLVWYEKYGSTRHMSAGPVTIGAATCGQSRPAPPPIGKAKLIWICSIFRLISCFKRQFWSLLLWKLPLLQPMPRTGLRKVQFLGQKWQNSKVIKILRKIFVEIGLFMLNLHKKMLKRHIFPNTTNKFRNLH